MWALILIPFKKFGGWIVAGLAIVASVFTVAEEEKSKGKLQQQTSDNDAEATKLVNDTNASAATQVKAVENENVAEKQVSNLPSGGAAAELLHDWQQPSASVNSASGPAKAGSD
jgi:hypothetical protein